MFGKPKELGKTDDRTASGPIAAALRATCTPGNGWEGFGAAEVRAFLPLSPRPRRRPLENSQRRVDFSPVLFGLLTRCLGRFSWLDGSAPDSEECVTLNWCGCGVWLMISCRREKSEVYDSSIHVFLDLVVHVTAASHAVFSGVDVVSICPARSSACDRRTHTRPVDLRRLCTLR